MGLRVDVACIKLGLDGPHIRSDQEKILALLASLSFHRKPTAKRGNISIEKVLYITNKTWSSVSNSSLSKTFALCQFRKLKVQMLCFLRPNVILGLKKMSPKII